MSDKRSTSSPSSRAGTGLARRLTVFLSLVAAVGALTLIPAAGAFETDPAPDWNVLTGGKVADVPPAAPPTQPAEVVAAPAVHAAPSTQPARAAAVTPPAAGGSEFGSVALRRGNDAGAGTAGAGTTPAQPSSSTSDAGRVLLALAVVLGVIYVLWRGGRKFFSLPTGGRSTRAVQVLSRSILSPRQQVVLIQVGRRIIVASDGAGQMNALSQITDPDEVAALLGQIRSERETASSKALGTAVNSAFGGIVDKVRRRFGQEESDSTDMLNSERAALLGVSSEPAGDLIDDSDFDDGKARAVVDSTRRELDGLREKLRAMSGRFGEEPKAET